MAPMDTDLSLKDAASIAEREQAYTTIAAALQWLRAHAADQPSLAELAAHVGLSEFHLQRLFARWAGISPKRFLQFLAKERARAALRAGEDVMGASLSTGLSGPGRLHDLLVSCEAVTPGEMRASGEGLLLRYGTAATPFGQAFLAVSERGVVKLAFTDADEGALGALRHDWPAAELVPDDPVAADYARRLFSGYQSPEPVHLFVKGTQFQVKVWEALLAVPEGQLTTYGDLARRIGQPTAARAVGSAVGANPIALLIPCHRVIRNDGALGGYRWGETRKQALISMELAKHALSPVD